MRNNQVAAVVGLFYFLLFVGVLLWKGIPGVIVLCGICVIAAVVIL